MTLLILAALLASAAAFFVIRPILVRRTSIVMDAAPGALLDAEAKRRATLASLKDLEYDWLGGKLDEADYRAQRDKLSLEALEAMRAAEAVHRELSGEPAASVESAEAVDTVEAAAASDAAEPLPAAAERKIAMTAIAEPPHACGFVNPAGSRFCGGCGKRLR